MQPFVAVTDRRWFEFLARTGDGRVDEVSFWSPQTVKPLRAFVPGEPVYFRLKSPANAIAGYAFFAHFMVATIEEAWQHFGWKNGAATFAEFVDLIAAYGSE